MSRRGGTARSQRARGTVVATDGSFRVGGRRMYCGAAYVDDRGDYWANGYEFNPELPPSTQALVMELRAIHAAVVRHPHPVIVHCDSQHAVALVDRWRRGEMDEVPGYNGRRLMAFARQVAAEPGMVAVEWVKGHGDDPLNFGADRLARLASSAARDSMPLTVMRWKSRDVAFQAFRRYQQVAA